MVLVSLGHWLRLLLFLVARSRSARATDRGRARNADFRGVNH